MMVKSNLYFLANEGDAILQESSFFNPSDVTADVKQCTLIDCKFAFFFRIAALRSFCTVPLFF